MYSTNYHMIFLYLIQYIMALEIFQCTGLWGGYKVTVVQAKATGILLCEMNAEFTGDY